jgi:predicted Zn-ribbon and HTH transcriptional regulator
MPETRTITQLVCTRCSHTWWPLTPKRPGVCPRCKSPYWDKQYSRADKIRETAKAEGGGK